jgi:RNA polymerase sigma-70 factor (ECF subfamily)
MIDTTARSSDNPAEQLRSTLEWSMASRDGSHESSTCEPANAQLEAWVARARCGDREALAHAMMSVRDYLLLVANEELDESLRAKQGASDLVQETFLRAQRRFATFQGQTAAEWRNWLRSILLRNLANTRRTFAATAKRAVHREVSSQRCPRLDAVSSDDSPSRDLSRRERQTALFEAIQRLPEHYQEVVVWHHRDRLPFAEIGRRRGISEEAARKLWERALSRLRKELDTIHHT